MLTPGDPSPDDGNPSARLVRNAVDLAMPVG
jgi:hypothetical protein